MVRAVKALGLETCCTLGMLEGWPGRAAARRRPRLLQPQPRHRARALRQHHHHARLPGPARHARARARRRHEGVLRRHRRPGRDRASARAGLLAQLASLDPQPESVPINELVQVEGTPLARHEKLPWTEFVRTIAVARILMPKSVVRLSAGRTAMSEAQQALCFFAGANSIFYGEKLLTTGNPEVERDEALFAAPRHPVGLRARAWAAADRLAEGLAGLEHANLRRRGACSTRRRARASWSTGKQAPQLLQQRLPRPRPSPATARGGPRGDRRVRDAARAPRHS